MRHPIAWITARLPHDWRDFWIQFGVFWTFYVSYELSGHLARGERSLALANGQHVIDTEKALGIYWEQGVQRWVLDDSSGFWLWLANNTYFNCQFTISFAFMLWVYFRRNHAFYFVRNTILFIDFIGLIGYFTIPTAPPRAFGGFVDTLHQEPLNMQSGIIKWFGNPYAAMPSLHSAYALTIGDHRRARLPQPRRTGDLGRVPGAGGVRDHGHRQPLRARRPGGDGRRGPRLPAQPRGGTWPAAAARPAAGRVPGTTRRRHRHRHRLTACR